MLSPARRLTTERISPPAAARAARSERPRAPGPMMVKSVEELLELLLNLSVSSFFITLHQLQGIFLRLLNLNLQSKQLTASDPQSADCRVRPLSCPEAAGERRDFEHQPHRHGSWRCADRCRTI